MSAEEHLEVACPRCNLVSPVRRKLLASPFAFHAPESAGEHIGIFVPQTDETINAPIAEGFFMNAFFCDACSIGFVTRELLQEVGIEESWIVNARVFVPWRDIWYVK